MELQFKEHMIKNLLAFLDRVEIKGLNEVHAMSEILELLTKHEESKK